MMELCVNVAKNLKMAKLISMMKGDKSVWKEFLKSIVTKDETWIQHDTPKKTNQKY